MHRAPRGGTWLEYELHGAGEPVLMIMGLGTTRAAWQGLVERLDQDHRLLAFDNLGTGGSGPIEGRLTMASMADDALAVMDHAGWSTAHVVGISLGGMIAQELALRARERVRSLTLLTTHAGGRGPGPLPPLAGLLLFVRQRLATMRGDDDLRMDLLMRLLFPPEVLPQAMAELDREQMTQAFAGRDIMDTLQAQTRAVTAHHTRSRLGALEGLPTLVVRSAKDLLVHPRAQTALHRAIPGAKLLDLKDAGHGALAQCPDEIAARLREHIGDAS